MSHLSDIVVIPIFSALSIPTTKPKQGGDLCHSVRVRFINFMVRNSSKRKKKLCLSELQLYKKGWIWIFIFPYSKIEREIFQYPSNLEISFENVSSREALAFSLCLSDRSMGSFLDKRWSRPKRLAGILLTIRSGHRRC